MRKNLVLFAVGVLSFLLFVLFSYIVHKDFFTQIDFDTTVRLQNNLPRRLDEIFSWFSTVGSFMPMVLVLVLVLLIWRKIITGIFVMSAFVGFHILEIFGKFFVNHPPPPEFMLRTKRLISFDQFHVRTEYSYPSGHSGRAVFIGIVLLFILWQTKRLSFTAKSIISGIIGIYILIMLISRVYLGEHWLSDVIGGGILAVASVTIALSTYQIHKKLNRKK